MKADCERDAACGSPWLLVDHVLPRAVLTTDGVKPNFNQTLHPPMSMIEVTQLKVLIICYRRSLEQNDCILLNAKKMIEVVKFDVKEATQMKKCEFLILAI